MLLPGGLGHLTYSTLVHPGDTWPEMWESLRSFVPAVKARVSPDAPFGVSLRLSGSSAATLAGSEALRAELRDFLAAEELYVYTVNAFPHGPFKGRTVMEDVYEPDWSTQVRLDYTTQVADVLADIALPGVRPTIQTAPLAYRAKVVDESYVQSLVEHLMRAVAHLVELERRTGVQVAIALEPEPACWLETTEETVRFFEERIYSLEGRRAFAAASGEPLSRVEDLLRRHLGVVFDICHQSVGFEDIRDLARPLVAAGVPILKLQAASALRVPDVTARGRRRARGLHRHDLPQPDHREARRASTSTTSTSPTPSPPTGATPPGAASGAPTSTCRSSSTTWAPSAPRGRASRTPCACTPRLPCRSTSRSRPTPGTCCRHTSRPATSWTT